MSGAKFIYNLIFQLISQQKSSQSKGQKAHVDAVFIQQLRALWKIIVPGAFSPEAGFMFLVAASLVARSLCDLWMIHNGTLIEGYLNSVWYT
jgi:ATP-binding cassette, subfamily D (ALD), member 3